MPCAESIYTNARSPFPSTFGDDLASTPAVSSQPTLLPQLQAVTSQIVSAPLQPLAHVGREIAGVAAGVTGGGARVIAGMYDL